ncbi:ATP-binding protein [Desulfosarcina sp.]|nr:ATP-binding protein [Desulfosarcina sp.]
MELQNAPNDSVRFMVNKKLSNYYYETDRRKNFEFNEEALKIARENKMYLDVATCLNTRGYYLNKEDQYGKAFESYIEAFKMAENQASELRTWMKPVDADPYQYRMQELATLHHNLGHVLRSTGNNTEAINQFRECMLYLDKALPTSFNTANMNIGAVYLDMNMLDSAYYYEKKAEKELIKRDQFYYMDIIFKYIGDVHFRRGEYDSAREYYQQGFNIALAQKSNSGQMICQMGLAQYYLVIENNDSSMFYANEFLNSFHELHGNPIKDINISIAYELLFRAYQLQGKKDSTMKYLKLAFNSRDSISKEKIKNLAEYQNLTFKEQLRLEELEKEKIQTRSKIRIYTLIIGLGVILLIAIILYRNSRQKQKANKILKQALSDLKSTQSQLVHTEKMASLGELTAGIAHEIQNPLNFVKNFSEVNAELIDELKEEIVNGNMGEVKAIADDIAENEEKIIHHGKRADAIVKGMLQHSQTSTNEKELTNINELADEYLRLAYHGLRAKDNNFNSDFNIELDKNLPNINIIPQDIGRVLLNLINNAFYACNERSRIAASSKGSSSENKFLPKVIITTRKLDDKVEIRVQDNGNGIPSDIKDKIFQPFFTTKPTGEGTGLGLSLSYDIITKGHGGELKVETKEGEGTEFIIQLPVQSK